MRFTFWPIAFSLLFSFVFSSFTAAGNVETFLGDHAVQVIEKNITDRIQFFLDPRYRKKQIFWYSGSLTSSDGEVYDKLQLKFNTVSNALYVNYKGNIYSVPPHALDGFLVFDRGTTRHFKKGYKTKRSQIEQDEIQYFSVSVRFNSNTREAMRKISKFEPPEDMEIFSICVEAKHAELSVANIEFSVKYNEGVDSFNEYFGISEEVRFSERQTEISEFDPNVFLEIKVIGTDGNFLKLNYKASSQSANMTQIKQTDTNIYNKYFYYIANRDQEVVEIQLTKKSIRQGLEFLGIIPNRIPSFHTEKQWAEYFKTIL